MVTATAVAAGAAVPISAPPLGEGFARLLAALRVQPHERVMVFRQMPGQQGLTVTRGAADDAPARALLTNPDAPPANTWFSVCPLDPEEESALSLGQRNSEATAARVPVLWADLDVKPGGLASFDQCREVIAKVSESLGNRQPVAIVSTGHGLQPFWGLDGGDDVPRAGALLRRFGQLVKVAAEEMSGSADSVFDIARILRVPGTWNVKDPANPLPVTVEFTEDEGYEAESIDLDELAQRLDELGIREEPERGGEAGPRVAFGTWTPGTETCGYAEAMIAGWASDSPGARHPWLVSQAVRLLSAARLGCLSSDGYKQAQGALSERFTALCGRPGDSRAVGQYEVLGALLWARDHVETRAEQRCWEELGHHVHADGSTPGETADDAPESEADLLERLALLDWNDTVLVDLPPIEWLVPDVLPEGAAAVLYSPAGVGKSLLSLELGAAFASGRGVLGHPATGSVRGVLYIDLENDQRLVQTRIRSMGYTSEADAADLAESLHYSLLGDWPPLDTREGGQQLVRAVDMLGVRVVIIDTTQRVISGKENESETFRELHKHSGTALKRRGVTVLRLDHAGKDAERGQRGSSGKNDDVDLIYRLSEIAPGKHYRLKREKNRPGLPAETAALDLYRMSGPLRHEAATARTAETAEAWNEFFEGASPAVADLIDKLDDLGVPDGPNGAGRDASRAALKAAGMAAKTEHLAEAVRLRKARKP